MKKAKQMVAALLAAVLLLGTAANAAIYNYFPDVTTDAQYAEAVDYLAGIGIFTGDDEGNFNPDKTITRAEFATIMVRMMGEEDRAKKVRTSSFTDVLSNHWACGYITVAVELGLVNGYGDGKYGPGDTLTYEQAVKVLICTMGYEEIAQSLGGWPQGYMTIANDIGILQGTSSSLGAPRSVVAMLTYNTIFMGTGHNGGSI